MGRWGEEEKKSQGLIGCFIALLIFGGFIFAFVRIYPAQEGRKQLKAHVEEVARKSHHVSNKEVVSQIMTKVRELNLPVTEEDIYAEKVMEQGDLPVMVVKIEYGAVMDFGIFSYTQPMLISERVPLIEF